MLVLSRKEDEQIVIGDDVRVTVVEIKGNRVKLGIQAPPTISIHRHEVLELPFRFPQDAYSLEAVSCG